MYHLAYYWLKDRAEQNFGDSLARVFIDRLFMPIALPSKAVYLCGSVIDDMFTGGDSQQDGAAKSVFWGCGVRTLDGLSPENFQNIDVLAVRGPISASVLGLEGKVPIGDSALLLPAIYQPRFIASYRDKTVCIPHFHDLRSEQELLALSQCDAMLRPNVGNDISDIYRLIDIIASAKFVLSASLHGAIVAAAYGRRFCFWNPGSIDLPLKWEDFAASVNIRPVFATNIVEAVELYEREHRTNIRLPPMLPLMESAPYVVRAEALAMAHEFDKKRGFKYAADAAGGTGSAVSAANRMTSALVFRMDSMHSSLDELRGWAASAEKNIAAETDRVRREEQEKYKALARLLNDKDGTGKSAIHRIRARLRSIRDERLIRKSGLFDERWYRETYRDVADQRINPVLHYIEYGCAEGRNPNPHFDTDWYLSTYPDVLVSRINPLVHYIKYGAGEGRNPSVHFSTSDYFRRFPDLRETGVNPLAHFLAGKERRVPSDSDNAVSVRKPRTPQLGRSGGGRGQLTVVLIDSIYPTPDKDSGSIDAANFISIFLQLGFRVVFISDSQFHDTSVPVGWLEGQNVEIVNGTEYPSVQSYIQEESGSVDLFFLSRVYCGGRYLDSILKSSNAKIVFNTVDLHFLREERAARLAGDRRAINTALKTRELEIHVARHGDAAIVVSKEEEDILRELAPSANIHFIPLARDCPGAASSFEERSGIGFVGGFAHTPNVDAIEYFVAEIWPIIRKEAPDLEMYIYGSNMPEKFNAYAADNIVPVGYVEDLASALEQRRLLVAPLRFGAGAKGKIISSLAHGVPCVSSPIGVEGMGLTSGENIIVAATPEEFAREVLRVYADKELWQSLSQAGAAFVKREYSRENMMGRLQHLLDDIGLATHAISTTRPEQRVV